MTYLRSDRISSDGSSSLFLQLLLITCAIFCPMWWILTLALLIYKAIILPYPPTALGLEITCSLLVWLVQIGAVNQGKRGNLTENIPTLAVGVLLIFVTVCGATYYMWFQTYVMMLDLGFSATLLALNGLAFIWALMTMQGINSSGAEQFSIPTNTVHRKSE